MCVCVCVGVCVCVKWKVLRFNKDLTINYGIFLGD